jgi:hypothetical protein
MKEEEEEESGFGMHFKDWVILFLILCFLYLPAFFGGPIE